MKIDRDALTPELELEIERANGRRLAAALRLTDNHLHPDTRAIIVVFPVHAEYTLGDVIDGAIAMHEHVRKELDL